MSSRRVIEIGKQGGYKDLGVSIFILVKLVTFKYAVVHSLCFSINIFYVTEERDWILFL